MVQKRTAGRGASAASSTSTNPFDSDDESQSPKPAYKNPFDDDHPRPNKADHSNPFDDHPKPASSANPKNPFDDEAMWNRRNESSSKQNSPPDRAEKVERPRRRDVVKEKLTAVSGDLTTKASQGMDYVRPRSRNLMGGNNKHGEGQIQERQLLFEGGGRATETHQDGHARSRIDQAYRAGESLDGESVQELEGYAVHKAEETTAATYKALKLAEDIKETATNTSIMLHEQGHQITRTHETAASIDVQLSRGEKLLGSLGGLFSKTWKPKKTRNITGPMLSRGDSFKRKAYGMEQRAALGLTKSTSPRARTRTSTAAVADSSGSQFQSRVKNEFDKQDDALADLSNVLDQLKEMSVDMGTEIGRQTEALGHVEDDVVELGDRVRGANERTRRLLGR